MNDINGNRVIELKIRPEYFKEVRSGYKRFELRKNDRDYAVGDILVLNEYDGAEYTGESIKVQVRYILKNCPEYGLQQGYCILGF